MRFRVLVLIAVTLIALTACADMRVGLAPTATPVPVKTQRPT